MERRGVDMVRLEKPEEVYDIEEVLGRDAASVFPSMNKQLDPMEQLKAAMGAKRFVTETELEEIKAARGLSVDDGTAAADKPLAEILAERKKAKQDAFEQQWKEMKTGKNRPLDADEMQFLDTLAQQEAAQQRALKQQEQEELDAYRQAVAAAAAAKAKAAEAKAAADLESEAGSDAAAATAGVEASLGPSSNAIKRSGSGASRAAAAAAVIVVKPPLALVKPIVKVKPKAAAGQQGSNSSTRHAIQQPAFAEPDSKRQRVEAQQQQQNEPSKSGLVGLLGGYGSGSDDDS